jgi:DNA-directed RNA polymerase beta' subunit
VLELKDGKYEPVDQYILISDGSNFLDVRTHPDVDPTQVISSNVHDMYENLGIEATRATLYKEITTLFQESGSNVNYRHISILLDKMCHKGRTMSIDRYGINKNDIGPLAKMSFEQTEDIALRAAIFGERDPVLGVSAKVMLGAPIKAGTGFSEILFDELAAVQFAESTPEQRNIAKVEKFRPSELDTDDPSDVCAASNLRLNVAIPEPTLSTVEETEEDINVVMLD